jgi:hypothetical protein
VISASLPKQEFSGFPFFRTEVGNTLPLLGDPLDLDTLHYTDWKSRC